MVRSSVLHARIVVLSSRIELFLLKHCMCSRRTGIRGVIAGQHIVQSVCQQLPIPELAKRAGRVLMGVYFSLNQRTSSHFF